MSPEKLKWAAALPWNTFCLEGSVRLWSSGKVVWEPFPGMALCVSGKAVSQEGCVNLWEGCVLL